GISMTAGDVYTVAGSASGASGASGNGVLAASALLSNPISVALDSAGDLFIADQGNNRIEEVPAASGTYFTQPMTLNRMYTVAGNVSGTPGISGDGSLATSGFLNTPMSVATDSAGDLFIADMINNRIQEVPAATGGGMTAADMYTVAGSATGAAGSTGD